MKKQFENVKDERQYFGILRRVGLQGNYQTNLMWIIYIISAVSGATFNVVPFLFYQQPFQCANFGGNCNQLVCSLPQALRYSFLPPQPLLNSLANHYGDTHCEQADGLLYLKQFFLTATSIGVFAGILFVEPLGKKRTIAFSLFTSAVSIGVLVFLEPFYLKGAALFLWGGSLQISHSLLAAIITEVNSQKNRIQCYAWRQFWYVFGCLLNLFFFYILEDWKWVLAIYFFSAYILSFVAFFYYFQGTPIELISKQTLEDTFQAFMRIARRNNMPNHGITLQQIQSMQLQYKQQKNKNHNNHHFNVFDLIRYPSIRSDFLKLSFLYFLAAFLANSHLLLMDQFNTNIFTLSLINIVAQFLAIPLFRSLLMNCARRKSLIVSLAIITVGLSTTFALAPNDCFNCKSGWAFAFILISYFLTRFTINIAVNLFLCLLNQSFPAQIRSVGIYSAVGVARLSTVILPYSIKLKNAFNFSLLLQFSCLGMLGIFGAWIVRQTWGMLPKELIQELETKKSKLRILS